MNYVHVENSSIVLLVDIELELRRAELFKTLLNRYADWKSPAANVFDYARYQALDPFTRCFDNAMQTAKKYGLRYYEGLLLFDTDRGKFPFAHGWCMDAYRNIVDSTLHKHQGVVPFEYWGLPIKIRYSEVWKKKVGYYGCLDGDKDGRKIGVHCDDVGKWLG